MATQNEQTIIALEHKFWQAIVDNDTETAVSMLAEKSFVAGAQGVGLLSHDDYRRMAREGEGRYVLKAYSFEDETVTFPADGVAVIAYKVSADMVVEGKPLTLKAADTTTWILVNGDWLAACHTESLLGDPFGQFGKPG